MRLNEETIRRELAGEFGEEIENFEAETYLGQESACFDADGFGWRIFPSEEAAEAAALAVVTEMLEDEPELFTQSWLENYYTIDLEDSFSEWDYEYATEIADESGVNFSSRLIDEMVEWDVLNEEKAEGMTKEEALASSEFDDFVEALTRDKVGNDGGAEYYRMNFGDEAFMELIKKHGHLQVGEAAEDAVATDGWPHFLNGWDGNYEATDNGMVFYKENEIYNK